MSLKKQRVKKAQPQDSMFSSKKLMHPGTRQFRHKYLVLATLILLSLVSCSNVQYVHRETETINKVLEEAKVNGAYLCAPRELALAEAHLEFANEELLLGDSYRAEEHMNLALTYSKAAYNLSPKDRCGPKPPDTDGDGLLDPQDDCPEIPEDFDTIEDQDGCPEDQDTDGDGLNDSVDICPIIAEDADGFLDEDGCPENDNDQDGIRDEVDRCRNEAEDLDGWRDEDGCPENDNDVDTVLDLEDKCPNEPGEPKDQGCPVYEDVVVTTTHIHILQKVYFETNKAVIRPVSFPILQTVGRVLNDYPLIKLEIQGHTDSRGSDRYNQDLSQRRSESVREFLIQLGIDASRLTAKGYGEEMPIESNRTASGRAANRRVEFVRTDDEAKAEVPEDPNAL